MHGSDFSTGPLDDPNSKSASEQVRLEAAIRRADDLLFHSLKADERRRRTKLFILIGGIAMLTAAAYVLITFGLPTQVASTATPNATQASDKSGQLTEEGWRSWQSHDLKASAEKFAEAVKLAPKNTSAWNGLGWSQFSAGQNDEAEKAFQRVIELEPNHPAALNGLGQLAFVRRKFKDAKRYLLKAAPQASAAWYGLAKIYLLEGNYKEAKHWTQKIVDSGQANEDESVKQVLAAAEAGKLDPRLRAQIEPTLATSLDAARAWVLLNQGRGIEAKELFKQALTADPKDAAALNGLGWLLFNRGDIAEAKTYFEKALKIQPEAGGAMNGLARVLKNEGNLDKAMEIWAKMIQQNPDETTAATYGLADAYVEQGEYKKALPLLEQIVKANPNDVGMQAKLTKARERTTDDR